MPAPVQRLSLSEQIYQQLRDEILNGAWSAGQRLPAERELCRLLGVTRGPLREALKRLEQAGLVAIRHGGGTEVLDWEIHGGLDLLPALAMPAGRPNFEAIRGMFEARTLIAAEMSRLAATRIGPQQLDELGSVVQQIETCDDPAQLGELDVAFHGVTARAAQNLVYRLIFNSTRDLYRRFAEAMVVLFDLQTRPLYRQIRAAIAAGEGERAAALCTELMDGGARRVLGLLDQLSGRVQP